jgi:hypothetical protein
VTEKTSQEIENEIMEKEKELQAAEAGEEVLELEDLRLAKEMAETSLKRKNIAPGLVQASHNCKRIRHDLKTLETLKWQALRQEKGF